MGVPVFFLLLFVGVFGNTLRAGLGAAAPSGGRYIDYLLPGILVMTAAACAETTAVMVSTDMTEGIVARFRTMPIARGSVLTGQVLGSAVRTMVSARAGRRRRGAAGVPADRDAGRVAGRDRRQFAMLTLAVTWLTTSFGLLAKTPAGANSLALIVVVLPFVSSAFVPTESMPSGARWFAENQPFTPVIETIRGLLTGTAIGSSAVLAVAWCAAITAVGVPVGAVPVRPQPRDLTPGPEPGQTGGMETGRASRTAVLVCQGRAAADGRLAPGVFSDPVAVELLRDDERVPVELVRAGTPPSGAGGPAGVRVGPGGRRQHGAAHRGHRRGVAARPCPQLVVLGAGLDDRAWRMRELADVDVLEVDHPASQADKRDRVGGLPRVCRSLESVAVDFTRDSLDVALDETGHDRSRATTWLWEGVVPYLTEPEVARTLAVVARRSAGGSRLVVNYQAPSLTAKVGRLVARGMARVARQPDVWTDEPVRSVWTPDRMAALLRVHGFSVVDDSDMVEITRPARCR